MTVTLRKLGGKAVVMILATLLALCPLATKADDNPAPDARIDGYPNNVAINEGGTGGTITFFIILAGVTAAVMFMNSKRSHLD
jgi:hypothetical protein